MPDDAAQAGPPLNSAGFVDSFREMVRDCDPELYQQFVDVLVERGIPDDPDRAKTRDYLLHNFTVIYETGGDLQTPKGVVKIAAPRTALANQDQHDKAKFLHDKLDDAEKAEETARKTWGAPLFEGNKRLIAAFDPRATPLEKAKKKLKILIGDFLKAQREAKEKAEREAREKAKAAEKAAQEAAAQGSHNAEQLAAQAETARLEAERKEKATADAGRSKSATGGGSHLRVTYSVKVVNRTLVPQEFLKVDLDKALIEMRPHPDGSPGRIVSGLELVTTTEAVVRK